MALPVRSQGRTKAIYRDPSATIPDRVRDLLSQTTVEEKVAQLESGWNMPVFGSFKLLTIFVHGHLNDAMVRKIADNGLGAYAFIDEFLGTSGPANPGLDAQMKKTVEPWPVEIMIGSNFTETSSVRLTTSEWPLAIDTT